MRFRFQSIIVLLLGLILITPVFAASEGEVKDVNRLLDRAKQLSKKLKVKKPHNDKAEEAAKAVVNTYHSREFQQKLQKEIARIKHQLLPQSEQMISKENRDINQLLAPTERIYVFISSSVPVATLRNYAADIDRIGDPNISMVMRGFVGGIGRLKPTLDFIQKILVKDQACDPVTTRCDTFNVTVNIDPLLYQRYQVGQVPTIVYVRGLNITDPGLSEGMAKNATVGDAYILSGDVSLEYALDKIRRASQSRDIEGVISQLKGGFYR